MSIQVLNVTLLVGALVVLVAALAVRVSARAGLPSLLVYLALGIALGESGAGIRFDDVAVAQALGLGALVVILAEGGLTTRWDRVRPVVPVAAVLSTLGIAVSIAVTAVVAKVVLGVDWRLAVLLAAALSPTDAAAVFATLRRVGVRPSIAATLEAESGFNDAPVVIVVTELSRHAHVSAWPLLGAIGYELVVGAALGVAIGFAGVAFLRRSALPAAGLYPIATVALTVLSYGAAAAAHGSGFLAVYVTAVWLGNADLPHRRATLGFAEGLAWLAQIGLFVMLGLLVTPATLPRALLPALAVGAALLLVARPASVAASAVAFRVPYAEQALLSWAGLRGAVPIVLATIPLTSGVPGSRRLFDVVFVVVAVFTLVQGPTLPRLARRLSVLAPAETRELQVETAPLEELHADLLQLRIPAGSRLHGVELSELRLPTGAAVTLVVRGAEAFVPRTDTRLRRGDDLLVVATTASRKAAEQRLREVSHGGRLARWRGEPDTR